MNSKTKGLIFIGVIIVLIFLIFLLFKNNTYEIVYYVDGEIYQTVEARRNRKTQRPENPNKEGYVFLGWYTEENEVFDFDSKIKSNMKLIGYWGTITKEE